MYMYMYGYYTEFSGLGDLNRADCTCTLKVQQARPLHPSNEGSAYTKTNNQLLHIIMSSPTLDHSTLTRSHSTCTTQPCR